MTYKKLTREGAKILFAMGMVVESSHKRKKHTGPADSGWSPWVVTRVRWLEEGELNFDQYRIAVEE